MLDLSHMYACTQASKHGPLSTRSVSDFQTPQVGYPLGAPKRAIAGAWLGSSTAVAPYIHAALMLPNGNTSPFTVVNAVTKDVAFSGTAQLFGTGELHEYYKQLAWHLDFSALDTPVSLVCHKAI
jgi:hypothetical protein